MCTDGSFEPFVHMPCLPAAQTARRDVKRQRCPSIPPPVNKTSHVCRNTWPSFKSHCQAPSPHPPQVTPGALSHHGSPELLSAAPFRYKGSTCGTDTCSAPWGALIVPPMSVWQLSYASTCQQVCSAHRMKVLKWTFVSAACQQSIEIDQHNKTFENYRQWKES